jgi:hypothetical protein
MITVSGARSSVVRLIVPRFERVIFLGVDSLLGKVDPGRATGGNTRGWG